MDDIKKTKKQLIDELVEIRKVISENKLIEDEKAKTNSVLEGLGVGLIIQDLDYKVTYENKHQQSTVGNHVGEYCYMAYESKDHICKDCPMVFSLQDRKIHRTERMISTAEGNRYYELISSPLINSAGNITGGIKLVKDITESKQMAEDIQEREQYLQSIINAEPECVKIILSDGTLVQMNPAGLKMIEADSIEQVVGKSVYPIIAPKYQDAFRELTESVCLGNQGLLEFEIIGLKGTHRWLETHAVSLRNAQNEIIGLLGVTRDITEHKRALEEINQLNKELEELIYTTSHDLRTPLVNIHGYSREFAITCEEISKIIENEEITPSLRLKLSPLIKDISESVTYVDSSVNKMDSLLAGLLQLSRTGRTELQMEEIDMNSLMSDIYNTMEFQIRERGAKVEIEELPSCKGDKELISQVFSNLLNNALKYLANGRNGKIKISGSIKDVDSIYNVKDNGIGISPEHHEKIFEIFYQLDPSSNADEGLGLSIAKKIISKHRGKVWVESELGKGSKFIVSLPKA